MSCIVIFKALAKLPARTLLSLVEMFNCIVHFVRLATTPLKDEDISQLNPPRTWNQQLKKWKREKKLVKVKKGKVFPYSLPSVGPGADPSVQAVSPQVT